MTTGIKTEDIKTEVRTCKDGIRLGTNIDKIGELAFLITPTEAHQLIHNIQIVLFDHAKLTRNKKEEGG